MFEDGLAFNRYTNLDNLEWRIVDALVKSQSKFSDNLWKLLKYPEEDCLFKESLSVAERYDMIYRDNGLSTERNVFLMPFIDDAWDVQSSRLDIFVDEIFPKNQTTSQINVGIEIVVHNKIGNVTGEAEEGIATTNPSELSRTGEIIIPVKNRATLMLKCVLAELNGQMLAGVGDFQCNASMNPKSKVESRVWNNHAYYGFKAVMTTLMSGVSENSEYGY